MYVFYGMGMADVGMGMARVGMGMAHAGMTGSAFEAEAIRAGTTATAPAT